jgi:hypothetical protein
MWCETAHYWATGTRIRRKRKRKRTITHFLGNGKHLLQTHPSKHPLVVRQAVEMGHHILKEEVTEPKASHQTSEFRV